MTITKDGAVFDVVKHNGVDCVHTRLDEDFVPVSLLDNFNVVGEWWNQGWNDESYIYGLCPTYEYLDSAPIYLESFPFNTYHNINIYLKKPYLTGKNFYSYIDAGRYVENTRYVYKFISFKDNSRVRPDPNSSVTEYWYDYYVKRRRIYWAFFRIDSDCCPDLNFNPILKILGG